MNQQQIREGIEQFAGTTAYHRLSPLHGRLVATDGVAWLCREANCYWLLDAIASYQPRALRDPALRDCQFWTLKVKDGKGTLTVERDRDDIAFKQDIEYTDFPLNEVRIWVESGVALLPSEH